MVDSEGATLEVGFSINPEASFSELTRLQELMDSTEARVVADAAKIERATAGMVKLGDATAQISTFGNAISRESFTAARELTRIEKSGESLVRQLEKQNASFGKSRDELRAMKVETAALAAEQQGLTELAGRLRAEEAALYDQEFAAARQASQAAESAAEDRAMAAQRAVAAAEVEAKAVREAAWAYQMFEVRVRQGTQAMREAEAAQKLVDRDAETIRLTREAEAARKLAAEHSRLADIVRGSHAAQLADVESADRLRASTDPLYSAQKRLNGEIAESTRLYHAGVIGQSEYARQQDVLAGRLQAAGAAHEQMDGKLRKGTGTLTQLSFQLNDVATMAAMGAPPFQIFASQAGQIFQVAQMAEGGIKGFASEMGALAVRAAPVALAIGVAAFAFKGFADQLEDRAPIADYIKSLGLTAEEAKKLTDTHVTLGDAAGAAWDMIREALNLGDVFKTVKDWASDSAMWLYGQFKDAAASVYAALKAAYDNVGAVWRNLPSLIGDAAVLAVNKTLDAVQALINEVIGGLNWLAQKSNDIFGTSFGQIGKVDLGRFKGQYSAAGTAFGAAFGASFNSAYSQAMGAFDAVESGALKNRNDRLKAQADKIIKDRKTASTKAGDDAAKEAAKQEEWLAEERMKAQGNVWKLAQEAEERNRKWKLDGLTVGEQLLKQEEEAARLRQIAAEEEERKLNLLLQQLFAMQQMGGLAGTAGGVLSGLLTGNFGGVEGKLGQLLDGVSLSVGPKGWKSITDKLDSIFGTSGDGSFAKIMQKTFAAGGVGSLGGSAVLGSANSGLGSFAGGAIGEKIGEKFLTKALGGLGDFAGPLGSIVGGVLGGALGGLLTKAKWGTSVVTGQGDGSISTTGNKAAYTSNAGLAANSIQTGLQAIADQLGADVGRYNVSVGQYKGDWRVSSAGRTGKLKGKYSDVTDFGEEGAADAIKFAIADAISDGALLGLRASTQRLLQGGSDVEAQLAKALQFESVFSQIQSMTDPIGYAVDQLDKEFSALRKTFDAAGASVDEYAKLQQLYDLKRIEALKEANNEAESLNRDRRSLEARILELQGDALASVAIMRQIELEQMDASLRGLQKQVWAMEDAADAAAAAQQLADAWSSIGNNIMDEVNRIRGMTDSSNGNSFAALFGQFNAATGAARVGDQDAANSLAGLSQSVLDAASLSATSRQELDRVRALVAASLEQTFGILSASKGAVLAAATPGSAAAGGGASVSASLAAVTAAASSTPAQANDNLAAEIKALRDEMAQLRSDNNAGHAATAGNTGAIKRTLDNVTADSGGQAVSVAGVAA